MRLPRWRIWVPAVAIAAVTVIWHSVAWQRFVWFTGARDEPGPLYGFWSGFGGSWLPGYLGLAFVVYWHHQCQRSGCWRWGRHATASGLRVCRRDHPDLKDHPRLTAEVIHRLHAEHKQRAGRS